MPKIKKEVGLTGYIFANWEIRDIVNSYNSNNRKPMDTQAFE